MTKENIYFNKNINNYINNNNLLFILFITLLTINTLLKNGTSTNNIISNNSDINFISKNNMTQEGTNIYALNGDINYNITNNLDILASKDTYSYTEKTSTKHAGISVGTKIDSNMALNGLNSALDLGGGNVSNKVKSTTYNNVDIIANNINIKTGNNADIKGANITAKDSIDMDIGNNLNIESLQDTYYAKSKNNSWSASASFSAKGRGDGPKYSGGIGGGGTSINSTTDSQWVNEQTSIIADNNINIRTKNNTNLTGSVVASNTNNLTLNTNSLTYQDLNDFYTSTTKGSGLTTNIGTSSDSFFKGIAPNGTTTITLVNSGEDKKQDTRATIGNGNIVIADNKDISDLNRNVANSQNITQDQITGALNGEMKIDNRIFTPDGLVSIYSDAKNLAGNTFMAVGGALSDTKLVLNTSADILGAIPLSPVWYSRKKPIPPHPFPSFGIGDEVMGESSFRRDQNNKPIPDEGYLNVYTQKTDDPMVSDRNILFRFLYAFVPGGKSMTDNHDIEMNKILQEGQKKDPDYSIPSSTLKKTILPSFLETLYGIPGTILDFKNYGENYRKIKNSYNNGIPRNRTIIRDTSGKTIYNDSWRLKNDKK